jgi:hypothetical protein
VVFLLVLLGASAPLGDARAQYAAMRFKAVVETLEGASVEPGERREAADLQARALIALGRADEAEAVWVRLLEDDPLAEGPVDAAPKIQAVFERARARVPLPAPSPVPEPAPEPEAPTQPKVEPPPQLIPEPPRAPHVPVAELAAPAEAPGPRWIAWSLAAGAGVSLGVGSALAAWSNGDSQAARAARWASDARALDERALGSAVAANVMFAGALVAGITSGILLWRWR